MGITAIYTICAWLAWLPGLNATEYDIFEDLIYSGTVYSEDLEICRVDYDVPVTFYVVGSDGLDFSEPSETLTVVWPIPEPNGPLMLAFGISTLLLLHRRRLKKCQSQKM
jgi:hypothetical protein